MLLIRVFSFKYVIIFLDHSNSFSKITAPIIVEIVFFTDVEQIFIRQTHLQFISFEINRVASGVNLIQSFQLCPNIDWSKEPFHK